MTPNRQRSFALLTLCGGSDEGMRLVHEYNKDMNKFRPTFDAWLWERLTNGIDPADDQIVRVAA